MTAVSCMRVLYFLDTLNRGGAERQAVDVCKNAAAYGIDVTVVAGPGDLLDELRGSGTEVFEMNRRLPIDPFISAAIRKIIREKAIQVVHGYQAVEGVHLHLATLGMPAVKRVLSFQGFIPDAKNRRSLRFLIPRMDANLYVSRGLQNWLADVDGLNTQLNARLLYNGADPARLEPTGRSVRSELGIGPKTKVFGMIANFYRDPRKDQATLARALPAVFASLPESVCLFAGKTEEGAEEKLELCRSICSEAGILDRVFFLGGRSDVPDILRELDVFVFSSLQEGLPVALTEAMLAGVPCVVSDIGPHLEATDDGRVALAFRTGDAADLAEQLSKILGDERIQEELASNAAHFATANFSIHAHMTHLRAIYSDLLN